MLAVIRQLPNDVSIFAILRIKILDAYKRYVRDVGVISTKQVTVVVNDLEALVESAHLHLFLSVR